MVRAKQGRCPVVSDWNCVGHMLGALWANGMESQKVPIFSSKPTDFCCVWSFLAFFSGKSRKSFLRGDFEIFFLRRTFFANTLLFLTPPGNGVQHERPLVTITPTCLWTFPEITGDGEKKQWQHAISDGHLSFLHCLWSPIYLLVKCVASYVASPLSAVERL